MYVCRLIIQIIYVFNKKFNVCTYYTYKNIFLAFFVYLFEHVTVKEYLKKFDVSELISIQYFNGLLFLLLQTTKVRRHVLSSLIIVTAITDLRTSTWLLS